jgi:hypothetical protein
MNINKLIYGGDIPANDETIKIRPRRVFQCEPCDTFYTRGQVKKVEGKYFCPRPHCGKELKEKTDSETGQNLMEIINL